MTYVPPMAIDVDGEGFLVFPTDHLEGPEFSNYLYDQSFYTIENRLKMTLSDSEKEELRNRFKPNNIRGLLAYVRATAQTIDSAPANQVQPVGKKLTAQRRKSV